MADEPARKPDEPERSGGLSTRGAIAAGAGVVAILGLAFFVAAHVAPVLHVHRILDEVGETDLDKLRIWMDYSAALKRCRAAVDRLGGASQATRRLATYARLPRWLATRKEAALCCLRYGDESAAAVLEAFLKDKDADIRKAAMTSLSWGSISGPKDSHALAVFEGGLSDESPAVRKAAVDGIGSWAYDNPDAERALPALRRALADDSPKVRHEAVCSLHNMRTSRAVSMLVGALKDSDRMVRVEAANYLRSAGSQAAEVVPALAEVLLEDELPEVREQAAIALTHIGPSAKEAVPALARALRDQSGRARYYAAAALGQIGPAAKAAAPALAETAEREKDGENIQGAALNALRLMGKEGVPALVRLLRSEKPHVQTLAMDALARMGPAAKEAVPALEKLAADANSGVSAAAAEALAKIRGEK